MNKKSASLFVIIFAFSFAIAWACVNPTANPPAGSGLISTNGTNVGIGTSSPGAKLEVVGTTKFGGIIDAVSNRIINVGNPTAATDAVNKDYVDKYGGVGGASPRLWGQGRPNSTVRVTGGGECSSSLNASIKVSRSERAVHWDNAASACPTGSWVCTIAERGTSACGSGNVERINCSQSGGAFSMTTNNTASAWVANVPVSVVKYKGTNLNNNSNPNPSDE